MGSFFAAIRACAFATFPFKKSLFFLAGSFFAAIRAFKFAAFPFNKPLFFLVGSFFASFFSKKEEKIHAHTNYERIKPMKKTFKLDEVDCANCAAKMEAAINKLDGVTEATVSFMTQKLTIEADEKDFDKILKAAQKAIKKIEPDCRIVID